MPYCSNCGVEVPPEAAYCPRCGFRGAVETRPELPSTFPPLSMLIPGEPLVHMRRLSWGVILLAAYMGLLAWAGLQETFVPQPPSPPVSLAQMPAPLLLVNAALLLFPLCTLLCLGVGLLGLRANVPGVKERLTWRIGTFVVGPLRLFGLLIAAIVVTVLLELGVVVVATLAGGGAAVPSLILEASFETLLVAFGWCLMVVPARALGPWTRPIESEVLSVAVCAISLSALFASAAQFVVAGLGATAVHPTEATPSVPPWVQGFSALAAAAGVFAVAWIARRIMHRMEQAPAQATAAPA